MNNAARHSLGTRCEVSLRCGDALDLRVTDDGRGIDRSGAVEVGLGSMAERARELGGECTVEPVHTGGTCVRARIPVHA